MKAEFGTTTPQPGQLLRGLEPNTLWRIVVNRLQHENVLRVRRLVDELDACGSPQDYYEFQRHLFGSMFEIATRRGACARAMKRLRQGQRVPPGSPDLSTNGDPAVASTWQFEVFMAERIERQLRCVGDGLAWRAFGYDRRIIAALARNDFAGSMNVASKGLGYELGCVQDMWQERRRFGLLHDLTNCLRIADVTEFVEDRERLLHEVKKSRRATSKQRSRMAAVMYAVNDGGTLPGDLTDSRLAVLSTRHQTDMPVLRDAIRLARTKGVKGVRLRDGRAIVVASLRTMVALWKDDPSVATTALESARARAIRRAGIATATHHLNGNSGDTAARSPTAVPLAVFPSTLPTAPS